MRINQFPALYMWFKETCINPRRPKESLRKLASRVGDFHYLQKFAFIFVQYSINNVIVTRRQEFTTISHPLSTHRVTLYRMNIIITYLKIYKFVISKCSEI